MNDYNHQEIEKKWQEKWQKENTFHVSLDHEKNQNEYILVEFPYPSGNLHVGHWYTFAGTDIYARFRRMKSKNVLYPMGFDSFGLPAENAAIKRNIDPQEWTYSNIDFMKTQLNKMGAIFDWSKSVTTSDPEYYKWTQWIFIQMFEKGLAYKKKSLVNWDPVDKTILANEQVMADGTAERSGAKVEKKEMDQWFLKITDYAERLYDDLDKLDWPEEIKNQQKNWIGKSFGSEFDFKISDQEYSIKIFTTRPDTLFGATYVVLAPEHEMVNEIIKSAPNKIEIEKYVTEAKQKKEIERTKNQGEKTGVLIEGVKVLNPANQEEIPVYISDYVLANYGTGAVMAVPAHDERDFEFATKFNLPIKFVLKTDDETKPFIEKSTLINSGQFDGFDFEKAKQEITKFAGGKITTKYKLRDWSVGRQRYWGCPVPIVYDPDGKPHSVPQEHLPWLLPKDVDHTPTGEPPLAKSAELKNRTEEIFGKGWRPEVETLDTFLDSSWYFLRYLDPNNDSEIADVEILKKWMPIEFYCGGAEHTTLHLLYSRFFNKFLFDIKISPVDEPYKFRLNHSLILGTDGNKMSKSKGNVVDPDEVVKNLGADTVRMYLAFMGPYNEVNSYPWDQNGVVGVRRFLEKVWNLSNTVFLENANQTDEKVLKDLHQTIKKTTDEISQLKFNTAIAFMMTFIKNLKNHKISRTDFLEFIKLLSVISPHVAEEIWQKFNQGNDFISSQKWPEYDKSLVQNTEIEIAVQINGKVRSKIIINQDDSEETVKQKALSNEKVLKWLESKEIKKYIYVKNRIVNIVI